MKDLVPEGWTRTPKPVSLSSHAIQGLPAGSRASTVRLVSVSLTLAVRLAEGVAMAQDHGAADATVNTAFNT